MAVEIKCKLLDENGMGEFYLNKRKAFCFNLLPGEKALVEMDRHHVRLVSITESSKDRVVFKCPHFTKCGGCQLSMMTYQKECEFKTEKIKKLFPDVKVSPILGAKTIEHYRNKTIATFARGSKGKVIAGQYELHSHRVLDASKCVFQSRLANNIVDSCTKLMEKYKIAPYDEDKKTGYLRHVLIRTTTENKALVCLVVSKADFPERKKFFGELKKLHPEIETIVTNINSRSTSVVLGEKEMISYGEGFVDDVLCSKTFRISSTTFYQIHHDQTEVLYQKAIDLAELKGNERILDAYCGIGTISMIVSDHVKEAVGVEINKSSVRNAIMNAKMNQISNCRYIAEDCTSYMLKAAAQKEHFDVVFMDPAREGSTPEFLNALASLKPEKIVYISCNPETQKRDVQILKKKGYKICAVQPVDMFPRTVHVESVVCLSREKAADYIRISVHTKDLHAKAN